MREPKVFRKAKSRAFPFCIPAVEIRVPYKAMMREEDTATLVGREIGRLRCKGYVSIAYRNDSYDNSVVVMADSVLVRPSSLLSHVKP